MQNATTCIEMSVSYQKLQPSSQKRQTRLPCVTKRGFPGSQNVMRQGGIGWPGEELWEKNGSRWPRFGTSGRDLFAPLVSLASCAPKGLRGLRRGRALHHGAARPPLCKGPSVKRRLSGLSRLKGSKEVWCFPEGKGLAVRSATAGGCDFLSQHFSLSHRDVCASRSL